jgi:taurine dioxygenase
MHLETPQSGLGVIATDTDVANLAPADWERSYQAWLEHKVLVVRGQKLSIEQFLDYSRRFGRLKPHRVRKTRHPEYPELTVMGVNTKTAEGKIDSSIFQRGGEWHTDGPWDTDIVKATQLYGLEVPSVGGDTLFADMSAAYDNLPAELKTRIANLNVEFAYGGRVRKRIDLLDPEDRSLPAAIHPIVHQHAETGRKSLYVNPIHIVRIVGLPQDESDTLIDELFTHMLQPNAQYRHQWQAGDVVIWDNRCTVHKAAGGYPAHERRVHWRVTIMQ